MIPQKVPSPEAGQKQSFATDCFAASGCSIHLNGCSEGAVVA